MNDKIERLIEGSMLNQDISIMLPFVTFSLVKANKTTHNKQTLVWKHTQVTKRNSLYFRDEKDISESSNGNYF